MRYATNSCTAREYVHARVYVYVHVQFLLQLQGLRDALDESERERRELEQRLAEEREKVREEGRRAQALEERLSCSGRSNTELEKVREHSNPLS